MRTRALLLVVLALVAGPAALASDEAGFKALKASFDKYAKNRDDAANRERRRLLLQCFDFVDQKACRKLLKEAYEDELIPDNRIAVVQVLGASGDKTDLDFLIGAFKKERAPGAVIALGQGLGYTGAASVPMTSVYAAALLAKHKGEVQRSLLEGLGEMADPAAYAPIVALGDKLPPTEAFERLIAMGACGKAQAVPVLARSAKSTNADLRLGATIGLARTQAPEAAPVLIEQLADADPRVVEQAAIALAAMKHELAKDALIAALGNAPVRVKEALRESLKAITGKDCGWSADAWKSGAAVTAPLKLPVFAGMPIASDRVVLMLDLSRSMEWQGRLVRAKDELSRYLTALPDDWTWGIVGAARTPDKFGDRLTLGQANKQAGHSYIDKVLTGGGCDLREAMQYVFRTLPDADTVVLATDSSPFGESSEDTPLAVIQELRKENRIRQVKVYVAFTAPGGRYAESENDADEYADRKELVKQFAESTDGKLAVFE